MENRRVSTLDIGDCYADMLGGEKKLAATVPEGSEGPL